MTRLPNYYIGGSICQLKGKAARAPVKVGARSTPHSIAAVHFQAQYFAARSVNQNRLRSLRMRKLFPFLRLRLAPHVYPVSPGDTEP